MVKKNDVSEELNKFKEYLKQDNNEDAKRPLLYPLFQKLFAHKFKIESDAAGADGYVEGQIIVECKSSYTQWLEGFYQALHYHRKFGLAYNTIIILAHHFVGVWQVNKLPEEVIIYERTADINKPPSFIGKDNAKRTSQALKLAIKNHAIYWLEPKDLDNTIFEHAKNLITESYEILNILKNIGVDRLQINTHNFINIIEQLKSFFEQPIDAVHAFYTMIAYWQDISSMAVLDEDKPDELRVLGFKGHKISPPIKISPIKLHDLKKFIDTHYIFTNEGSGLTVDYYFSRFDEVLAKIDPEYVKQHGIFFTNDYLSKFALWFVKENFSDKLNDNYIVFDPAGGSGNLISNWRSKLKHKVIAELQPDLLKIIERRMQVDPWHIEHGFTIIPKTHDNKGVNFLDCSAQDYLDNLKKSIKEKSNMRIDKPLAFLLNPPYKNTDENQGVREQTAAQYDIHSSILAVAGNDAGKERYLAFLGQILNMAKEQVAIYPHTEPAVMIFTPTSWLLPRESYVPFRAIWDQYFKFHSGFMVTSKEWFKLDGKWPLAFTIWTYNYKKQGNTNNIKLVDVTELKQHQLNISWDADSEDIDKEIRKLLKGTKKVLMNNARGDIRETLPMIEKNDQVIKQTRYDFSYAKRTEDYDKIVSGFPYKDKKNHFELRRKCGEPLGDFIGFMDDNTPVRIAQDSCYRMSNKPDRVWFMLMTAFSGINRAKVQSGAQDSRSYCAYNVASAKSLCTWFAISKVLNGKYPLWANQNNIWAPPIEKSKSRYWDALCFAYTLAENRCIVTKFEKDNPVKGAPEIFVDNPLCPINKESLWSTELDSTIILKPMLAHNLVSKIKELYKLWSFDYCKGKTLTYVGLQDEPYFKYFNYPDFLTNYSGLIQIQKYATIHGKANLLNLFQEIETITKQVHDELYNILVDDFKYFN
ncbi:MAG: hypothetical protein QM528_06815 [Phycisphaerales bacterium]|nr:hypothetical protein [Phycisphaerales bacterium]